jgi:hypothetical protein
LSSTLPPPPPPPSGPPGGPPSGPPGGPPSGPPGGPPSGPPGGPPGGPPSGPPGGPPGGPPEYLESGGGAPVPPQPRRGGSVKKGLFLAGGAVGLVAVGVGAWAAYNFFSTGPQPAEALPARTLGYASIDLDPSGGQKIEALRTLNKFPAFKDEVGINADDDILKEIFDRIQDDAHCDSLDYSDDIEPWLGDRAAMAAVDVGDDDPDAVVVVQVKDADKADAGFKAIKACGDGEDVGWEISGDWAVIAESDEIAGKVVDAAAEHSLADDEDFKKWTDEAGDPGVATFYAGPAAGDYFADHVNDLASFPFGMLEPASDCGWADSEGNSGDCYAPEEPQQDQTLSEISGNLEEKLRNFKGMAATVRFDDGAIEVEAAGDNSIGGTTFLSGGGTADVVTSLPGDTGAVLGLGFKEGWFGDVIDYIAPYTGEDADQLMSELSDMSGLDLPADAETLAGDSAALALGPDFDPDAFVSSDDGSDIPIALKIKGNPDEIEKVLDKLRDTAGPEVSVLESDSDGDVIVIGPNADYRADVLKNGDLGDNDVFKDVVREADKAQTVLFVNVDEFEAAIEKAADDSDQEFIDNLEVVSGVGATAWVDGDVSHSVLRLTTN